ncbi:hypothetical protein EYF80_001449 [Liparis tanakae]|uniref:Uncharacterized protein n=1 Tax=Liparis tanakae TaxID=230148 RepID=A0A4Z2JEL5_9TELE|nr:hypothetical protein EYF80_001449 [Liparis tanakae]
MLRRRLGDAARDVGGGTSTVFQMSEAQLAASPSLDGASLRLLLLWALPLPGSEAGAAPGLPPHPSSPGTRAEKETPPIKPCMKIDHTYMMFLKHNERSFQHFHTTLTNRQASPSILPSQTAAHSEIPSWDSVFGRGVCSEALLAMRHRGT